MGASMTLTTGEGELVVLESTCLLAFIDETGHEAYSDPKHPVFGLAGCLISVADYQTAIESPWQSMKANLFGGIEALHATDVLAPSSAQIGAIVGFFSDPLIHRFAAVATAATENPDGLHPYQLVAAALMARIESLLTARTFSSLALIVESSARNDELAEKYLGWYRRIIVIAGDQREELPIRHFLLPKQLNIAGLEVADFIANVAGRHARQSIGDAVEFGKDFQAFFQSVPRDSVEFIRVTGVHKN
jgi:hypothetical protein